MVYFIYLNENNVNIVYSIIFKAKKILFQVFYNRSTRIHQVVCKYIYERIESLEPEFNNKNLKKYGVLYFFYIKNYCLDGHIGHRIRQTFIQSLN